MYSFLENKLKFLKAMLIPQDPMYQSTLMEKNKMMKIKKGEKQKLYRLRCLLLLSAIVFSSRSFLD